MPATSEKQKQFMDAAAHNPAFAKQAGIPVSVAKEFSGASKGMKFGKDTNASRPDLQKVNKPKTLHGKMSIMKEGGNTMATKGVNPFAKFEKSGKDAEKKGMKEGSKAEMAMDKKQMMSMKKGGMASGGMPMKDGKPTFIGDGKGAMKKGGMAEGEKLDLKQDKSMMQKAVNKHEGRLHKGAAMTKLAGGGSFRASANGVASKGKTKGTMVKMNMGGKAC
jgi:hypothetical protein